MEIRRVWAMPSRNTFSIKPIGELIDRYATDNSIDPFANESKVAAITNDIDGEYDTDYHLNANDFVDLFDDSSDANDFIEQFRFFTFESFAVSSVRYVSTWKASCD